MRLQTKYFGEIEYNKEDVLVFTNGLFGFEDEKEFLLLPFEGSSETLLCFQSIQTSQLAFIAMNPFSVNPAYTPVLSDEELRQMEVSHSKELCYYVLCVVKDPIAESTLNFKCPVVVNPDTSRAAQVILNTDQYHMRHRLDEFHGEKGGRTC